MNSITDIFIGNRRFRWHSYFPFFIMLILIFPSCTTNPEPYSILEFTGHAEICNYSKSLFPILYESDSVNSTALLASTGDIIAYDENNCFYYTASSQKIFSIKTINNSGFINEKISSITIPGNDDMISWFKQMNSTDISALGFLYFDSPIIESYIPYLTKLAETKPDIGLGYVGDIKDLERIFAIFKPGFIVGVGLSQKDFNLLSGLNNLEFLSASLDDSIYTISLPAMPNLQQLVLTDIQQNAIQSEDFLINNKQLESLTILGSNKFDLSLIEPLKSLKELIINGFDTIENYNLIRNHNQIELLSVTGEKLSNDMALKELPNIRWMTFHEEAKQDEFNSFIKSHPDLEVVEI
ncbi:MAG: hypothetical protein MUP85_07640, partial [Candidatus Lokiarchaeota archaeon]|nr:hypothetical protein [Candidatus Lokiarchaeota archaeon]